MISYGTQKNGWSCVREDLGWMSGKGFAPRGCLGSEQAPQDSDHSITLTELKTHLENSLRHSVWVLGMALCRARELDFMIFVGPFQLSEFCDLIKVICLIYGLSYFSIMYQNIGTSITYSTLIYVFGTGLNCQINFSFLTLAKIKWTCVWSTCLTLSTYLILINQSIWTQF